jgi:hypothetical protein
MCASERSVIIIVIDKISVLYKWQDKESKYYQNPTQVPAKVYIRLAMEWIEKQIDNEDIFPKDGKSYPKKFQKIAQRIVSR